jgi:hypothetical protein
MTRRLAGQVSAGPVRAGRQATQWEKAAHDHRHSVVNEQQNACDLAWRERLHPEWKHSGAYFVSNFISVESVRAPVRLIFVRM